MSVAVLLRGKGGLNASGSNKTQYITPLTVFQQNVASQLSDLGHCYSVSVDARYAALFLNVATPMAHSKKRCHLV